MINQLLSKLGANTKITVGVSMSPGIGLEMVEIDRATKTIVKYSNKPLEYDYSKREIADYDRFRETLIELFDELKIPRKTNIILNLPSVHYGMISLSTLLSDEMVTNALISEVEQVSYIFKRQDPIISWMDAYNSGVEKENRDLLYGAIQQSALDEINAACLEVGCTLIAIETSFNSLLRTLDFNELATEQMQPNVTWNLMIINQNSYSIVTLSGKSVIEFREEPLALKSFVGDEIYNAIISSAQLSLQTIPSNYLYIVSETDFVSAEVLSMKIPFDGQIKFLESNKYVQNNLMQASYNILPNVVLKITPEVIGAGIYLLSDFPIKFNLLGVKAGTVSASGSEDVPRINIGNVEIELTSAFLKKFAMLVGAIIIAPAVIILFALNYFSQQQQIKLDSLNEEISQYKTELSNYENVDRRDEFDATLEINSIQSLNRTKLIYYGAIGMNLPPKTWLTYLKINPGGSIDLIGRANNVENVYAFYKGLKLSVINSDLRLHKLEMSSDSISRMIEDNNTGTPTFYEFEITNMTPEKLKAAEEALNAGEKDKEGSDGKSENELQKQVKKIKGYLPENFFEVPKPEGEGEEGNSNNETPPPSTLPSNLESIEKF